MTGKEQFNIDIREGNLQVNEQIKVTSSSGKAFEVKDRLDTDVEIEYFIQLMEIPLPQLEKVDNGIFNDFRAILILPNF